MASPVWWDGTNFKAWIAGVLSTITLPSRGSGGSNTPYFPEREENYEFSPVLVDINSPTSDGRLSTNIPRKNGTNAFTGANSFATNPLDLLVGQLKFPSTQNPSSDVNTLDDYEEGSWTPVLAGSGGTSGQTYTTQAGHYVKIGKVVFAWFRVELSVKGTITASVLITGLPFVVANETSQRAFMPFFWENLAVARVLLGCILVPNISNVSLYGATGAVTVLSTLTTADIADNTNVTGCIMYRTAN